MIGAIALGGIVVGNALILIDYINQLIIDEAKRIVTFPVEKMHMSWAGFYSQTSDEIYEYDIDAHIRIITGIGGKGMTSSGGYAEETITRLFS